MRLKGKGIAIRLVLHYLVWGTSALAQPPLPLQVGNFWDYRSADPMDPSRFRMRVVSETTMTNLQTYHVLERSIFPSEFLRTEGPVVYAFEPADSSEFTLFDFEAQPGDTMAFVGSPFEGGIVLIESFLDSLCSCKRWAFVHYWGPVGWWYEGVRWWITDSVGVTWMMVEPGSQWNLQGARIGTDTIGTVTGTEPSLGSADSHPELYQNYPNPFNRSTKINFAWPIDGRVKLAVYDMLGREVALLLDESLRPGSYQVEFDASEFPSGVYIYRLLTGGFEQSRKLVILK